MQAGLIIDIGAVAADSGQPVYAVTKWGLRGWSLSNYEVRLSVFVWYQFQTVHCSKYYSLT